MDGPKLLSAFLVSRKLTMRAFGAKVEAPASLVCRWANDEGTPGVGYALAIQAATDGAVPVAAWTDKGPRAKRPSRRSRGRAGRRVAPRRSAARVVRHHGESLADPKP
jgi:hypothetical protein